VSCHYCGNEGRVIDMPAQGFCWPWFQSHLNEEGGVPSRCVCPAGGKFPTLPMMTTANVAEEARACS